MSSVHTYNSKIIMTCRFKSECVWSCQTQTMDGWLWKCLLCGRHTKDCKRHKTTTKRSQKCDKGRHKMTSKRHKINTKRYIYHKECWPKTHKETEDKTHKCSQRHDTITKWHKTTTKRPESTEGHKMTTKETLKYKKGMLKNYKVIQNDHRDTKCWKTHTWQPQSDTIGQQQ